jgi:hypothetical protein
VTDDDLNVSLQGMDDEELAKALGAVGTLRFVLPTTDDLMTVSLGVMSRYLTAEAKRRGWASPTRADGET